MRETRRVDEEMKKRERLETERRQREKELSEQQNEDNRKELEECERLELHFFFFLIFNDNQMVFK